MGADDLPTILSFFKSDPTSRSVNNSSQRLDFDLNNIYFLFYQAKLLRLRSAALFEEFFELASGRVRIALSYCAQICVSVWH